MLTNHLRQVLTMVDEDLIYLDEMADEKYVKDDNDDNDEKDEEDEKNEKD